MSAELAILLVADSFDMIREVLRRYREQGDPRLLEIVVAALPGADVTEDSVREAGFERVRVVRTNDDNLAAAEARAVECASAPYVVFAQAHAFPARGFAEAVLARARTRRWAVVGPAMENANPGSALSRAAMEIGYGAWLVPIAEGRATTVPGHNSAYDRAALRALGAGLVRALPAGRQLQLELCARGGELSLESAARVEIVNVSRPRAFVVDQLRQGRLVAGERALHWTAPRRALYLVAAPLIPAVRLARIFASAARRGRAAEVIRILPTLALGLVAGGFGEACGYALGKNERAGAEETSLHRLRYVREGDRKR